MHSALRALLSLPLVGGKFVFTLIKSAVVIMLIFGGKLFFMVCLEDLSVNLAQIILCLFLRIVNTFLLFVRVP